MSEKKAITADELRNLVQAGVEREKLSILIQDFKDNKTEQSDKLMSIDKNISDIYRLIRQMPATINTCRDEIEKDFHKELDKHYVTESQLKLLAIEFNGKIDTVTNTVTNRFKWTTGLIVTFVGTIQFLTTMWYLGLQINKLTTGG